MSEKEFQGDCRRGVTTGPTAKVSCGDSNAAPEHLPRGRVAQRDAH